MIAANSIVAMAESFFVVGYVATILLSRPDPNDKSFFGGDLSRPFRKTLCLVSCFNVFRNLFLEDLRFLNCTDHSDDTEACHSVSTTWLYYTMVGFESFVTSFLNLLMPYLLRRKLSEYINIRPGQGLLMWVYTILVLDLAGVILSAQISPNMWAIKRLGDALTSIPAIHTINLYRRITTHPANAAENRHGQTFIQTVLGVEYWSLGITFVASAGYYMDNHEDKGNDWWRAFRVSAIFLTHLKIFMHGIMLNMIDEAQFLLANPPEAPNDVTGRDQTSPSVSEVELSASLVPSKAV